MKKVFTLFAAALVAFAAFADDVPCPSVLSFRLASDIEVAAEQAPANNVMIELQLVNASENLNGFNMEIAKQTIEGEYCEAIEWVEDAEDGDAAGFTGYGHTILAMWDVTNANWRETKLFQKADLKCNVKPTNDNLVIIEILSTLDCRFFPVLEEPASIARFTVDLSACADGDYRLFADATPSGCSFSFTGGPEGNRAWTADEPVVIELTKKGDIVTLKSDEPVVEPVTINGFVKDANGPLEGVTVTLNEVTREAITTTTDENGAYSLQYTPEEGKNYNVKFEKEGYTPQTFDAAEVPETVTLESINTGISTIGADNADGRIYDIQGRELKSVPEHGIYIQNGKKYVK